MRVYRISGFNAVVIVLLVFVFLIILFLFLLPFLIVLGVAGTIGGSLYYLKRKLTGKSKKKKPESVEVIDAEYRIE
jgi:Flp pilus assembly protein TadB